MKPRYITEKQMFKVDDLAMNKYGIKSEFLMENAGRNIAEFISRLKPTPKRVVVFFGKGNNGGDALVAARHLAIKNFKIELVSSTDKIEEVNDSVREQLKILYKSGIKTKKDIKIEKGDVIIDGLLGYSIKGPSRGRIKELIDSINFSKKSLSSLRVISVDILSGLDSNNSLNKQLKENKSIIKPDYILTLAMPKKSLKSMKNVYVLNIGVPGNVYKELGIIKTKSKNYFNKNDIVKIS